MKETRVRSLGWEDPLEKEMATHSSILAWRIPWTEEPGRLQSMGLQTIRHDWATNTFTFSDISDITIIVVIELLVGFPSGLDSRESDYNVGDMGSVPGLGRSPGEGNGYPLQYSWLENSMDRGAWRATVHGVSKSWTWLSDQHWLTKWLSYKGQQQRNIQEAELVCLSV